MGHRIKFARKSVGLSQKDLAKKLKITDKAVSTYEIGRVMPSILTLREISKLTYKPVSYFMAEETDESNELEERIHEIERELAEIKKALKTRKK